MALMYFQDGEGRFFSRFEAKQDTAKPGFFPGVLIIETGHAKGHYAVKQENGSVVNFSASNPEHAKLQKYQICITQATLEDVVKCGLEDENTKAKLDHGNTVKDIVGEYTSFRVEGNTVRADLTLDPELDGYKHANKLIQRFSKKIGNSIDFEYLFEIQGDKAIARCRKLNSVDIVDTPAATKAFFSEQPNQKTQYTMLTPEDTATITNAINTAVQASEQRLQTNFSTVIDKAVKTRFEEEKKEGEGDDKKEKDKEKDEDEKNDKLAALVAKVTLSTIQAHIPKAQLSAGGNPPPPVVTDDGYTAKFKAAVELGMTPTAAVRHIAAKFPALYNEQLASGQPTTLKL